MMSSPPSQLRIGTLQVRSISAKLGAVLSLVHCHQLHALCLQETCISHDATPAVLQAAGLAHYHFTRGLKRAMLPVPLMLVFTLSLGGQLNRCWSLSGLSPRVVLRPSCLPPSGQTPPLIGVYLQSGDAFAAASLLDSVLPWAASLGEDFCVLGDFNLPKTHWPTSSAIAAGHLFDAD